MWTMEHDTSEARLPVADLPHLPIGGGFDLLSGIRVLDLTTSIAGPFATMLLGDLGAEVIKVERPDVGDDARSWGPPFLNDESLWFLSVNRNKKSIALDYSRPEGLGVLHDFVRATDILVVNQPSRVSAKLGVDAASMTAVKNDLVYVSITGFGLDGERADWTCYDLIAEGYSGVMDLTGGADGEPQKVGAPAADMLAGQDAAFAALAAIIGRHRTGGGKVVDIALVDSMTRFLACRIVPYLGSGELPRRTGGKDSVIAIYETFQTADLPMTLGLGSDNLWRRFWEAIGAPEVGMDVSYASNADRRARRGEIVAKIQAVLATRRRAHWLNVLRAARVPAGPINRVDEVASDTYLQERGLFYRMSGGAGDIPQVGSGFRLDGEFNRPHLAPPRLGEHTSELLIDFLKYDADRVRMLAEAGVIASGETGTAK